MTHPQVLDQRSREALAWAVDFLVEHHPAPEESQHLQRLLTISDELGYALKESPSLPPTLVVAALVDVIEDLSARVDALEEGRGKGVKRLFGKL